MTCRTCTNHTIQIRSLSGHLRDSTRKGLREARYHGQPKPERLADIAQIKARIAEARRQQAIHTETCEAK